MLERVLGQLWHEIWPKGAVSVLLIPLLRYLWTLWRSRAPERRKQELRDRIRALIGYIEAETEAPAAVEDARRELALLRAELSRLYAPPAPAVRSRVRSALLLYLPARKAGWAPHLLFYMGLFVLVGAAMEFVDGTYDSDSLTAAAVWLGLMPLFQRWAAALDRIAREGGVRPRRSWPRRLLLLYAPTRAIAWVPHVLFLFSVFGCMVSLLMLASGDPEAGFAALVYAVMLALFWPWAWSLDYVPGAAREPRAGTTRPADRPKRTAEYWLALALCIAAGTAMVSCAIGAFIGDEDEFTWEALAGNWTWAVPAIAWLGAITAGARGWANAARGAPAECPGPPRYRGIRAVLLLYRPAAPAGWLPHGLFFLGCASLLGGLAAWAAVHREIHTVDLELGLLLLVVPAISKRWAKRYAPAAGAARAASGGR